MAYASLNDFTDRYDARLIQQLSVDDNSTLIGSGVIGALLADAQAEILTAALHGSIYTAAQLNDLVASGDTALVRLNCDLALKMLVGRRVGGIPQVLQDIVKRAEDMLEALLSGKRVLNISANRQGDVPAVVITTGLQRATLGDITQNQFWSNDRGVNTVNSAGT